MLDLYAGTGAVGLEALSRGAAHVDASSSPTAAAVAVLPRNVAAVGLPGARVRRRPVAACPRNAGTDEPFDLVFADPPYALPTTRAGRVARARWPSAGWLDADASSSSSGRRAAASRDWPTGIEPIKQRRYGEGVLWYGRRR